MTSSSIQDRMTARTRRSRKKGVCWVWTAGRLSTGYGAIRWNGRQCLAHRVAFELANGPIPKGVHVCHTCDNPSCVNPPHLFLGNDRDNLRDMTAKGRSCGKFTDGDVREIRAARLGGETFAALGRKHAVSYQTIANICRGERYRHVC